MAITYKILGRYKLLVATLSGRIDLEVVGNTIAQVKNDPAFVWNYDRLLLIKSNVDLSRIDSNALQTIKQTILQQYFGSELPPSLDLPAYRMAVVCEPTANAIILKLFGSFMTSGKSAVIDIQQFGYTSDALAWLERPSGAEEEVMQVLNP